MMSLEKIKNSVHFFLIAGILALCAGFFIVSCGTGPQDKVADFSAGHYALDFADCPGSACWAIVESDAFVNEPMKHIADKELTLEAWIKPHSTSTGAIFGRMDSAGAALYLASPTSTPTVEPKFVVRRIAINPVTQATSTVEHFVESGVNINNFLNQWIHIAGILTSTAQRVLIRL
jgi:hypothetical protein